MTRRAILAFRSNTPHAAYYCVPEVIVKFSSGSDRSTDEGSGGLHAALGAMHTRLAEARDGTARRARPEMSPLRNSHSSVARLKKGFVVVETSTLSSCPRAQRSAHHRMCHAMPRPAARRRAKAEPHRCCARCQVANFRTIAWPPYADRRQTRAAHQEMHELVAGNRASSRCLGATQGPRICAEPHSSACMPAREACARFDGRAWVSRLR